MVKSKVKLEKKKKNLKLSSTVQHRKSGLDFQKPELSKIQTLKSGLHLYLLLSTKR